MCSTVTNKSAQQSSSGSRRDIGDTQQVQAVRLSGGVWQLCGRGAVAAVGLLDEGLSPK